MFDSGVLAICEKVTRTINGGMPKEMLVAVTPRVFFADRSVSYNRLYQARGADAQVDRVVRVPEAVRVMPEQYAVFENGEQFRVDAAEPVLVGRAEMAVELTLIKVGDRLDVITE